MYPLMDPVVWLTRSLRADGADLHVLLRGTAVSYAVRGQEASGLKLGDRVQTQPPRIEHDLTSLLGKGADVYCVQDDVTARGITAAELIDGVKAVRAADLPTLFREFQQVWHW
jgi:intracellular sulfur oxidation DsrE/DsrF family protein